MYGFNNNELYGMPIISDPDFSCRITDGLTLTKVFHELLVGPENALVKHSDFMGENRF